VIPLAPSTGWWNQLMATIAYWAAADAESAIASLLRSFGTSTEPDFAAIGPAYDRMLAIALLLLGAVVALALIEQIAGGGEGAGWGIVGRVLGATFLAYCGLGTVQYLAAYAALLATAWTPDFNLLSADLARAGGDGMAQSGAIHGNLVGLILTALFLSFMSLLVYLELVVRSALILTVTVFVPLVCSLAVWPRMASAAAHLAEFLTGLLLSKFVVATVLYVGFHLVVPALVGTGGGDGGGGASIWMADGIAVLLIAAFSPVAIFQGLRFAHSSAGTVARDLGAAGMSAAPLAAGVRIGQRLLNHPSVAARRQQLSGAIASRIRPGGRA
jgi:hypothetical protein